MRVICLICMCDMTHAHCDMTHAHVWHDSCTRATCATWHTHMWDVTQSQVWALKKLSKDLMLAHLHLNVWHAWSNCVTGLMHMCAMTHAYVWRDSIQGMSTEEAIKGYDTGTFAFKRVTCLIQLRDRTNAHACHNSCIYVTWLNSRYERWRSYQRTCCGHTCTYTCDMTHLRVWHGACRCVPWLMRIYDVTQSQVWVLKKLSKDLLLAHERSYVWRDSSTRVTWHM